MNDQMPAIGRMVHYVLDSGRSRGEHRAAIVVQVWTGMVVNLQVFMDGTNDYDSRETVMMTTWRTSVHFSDEHKLGTWHWPEYVSARSG